MEKIYPPDKFPCSDHINLKSYFTDFSVQLRDLKLDPGKKKKMNKEQKMHDAIFRSMNIFDKERRKKILASCSVDLLTVPGELPAQSISAPSTSKPKALLPKLPQIPPQAMNLETVKVRLQYKDKLKDLYAKYKEPPEPFVCQTTSKRSEIQNIEPGSEFAVSVRAYYPFDLFKSKDTKSFNNLKFDHEVILLGSNTLANLRDKITCSTDVGLCVETEDPTAKLVGNAKEKYPSGFIFIDDVFYNDTRHENCIDYSEVIREWAKEKDIGDLTPACMETTRIDELKPRFGYPYIYQHQANCEHILVFADAWLLTSRDVLNRADYPLYKGVQPFRSRLCNLCCQVNAKWVCRESDRLPNVNTFMCQDCLMNYNYKEGKKVGSFKIYPYFERGPIVK